MIPNVRNPKVASAKGDLGTVPAELAQLQSQYTNSATSQKEVYDERLFNFGRAGFGSVHRSRAGPPWGEIYPLLRLGLTLARLSRFAARALEATRPARFALCNLRGDWRV